MDTVILCGGRGTRLASSLPPDLPKCLADINGTPFIDILVDHLRGIDVGREDPAKFGDNARFIFATGYGADIIESRLQARYRFGMHGCRWWEFSRETQPLGTAGAIKYLFEPRPHAAYPELQEPPREPFFILNGDTLCAVDYSAMLAYHKATNSVITVACDSQFRHVGTFVASKRFIELIPVAMRVDMAEVFTLLGKRHEPVGWFMTDAPFHDIGTPEGLAAFRRLHAEKAGRMEDVT